MPNWVMNKLELKGKPENLRAFLNACMVDCETREYDAETQSFKTVVKPLFSLKGIVPMPEVLEGTCFPHATSRMLLGAIKREVADFPDFPACDELSEESLEQAKAICDHFTAQYPEVAEEKTWLLDYQSVEGNLRAFQQTGYSNWYEWCVDHWGTKWDVSDDSTRIEDEEIDDRGYLVVCFDSAWSAPEVWFRKAVKAHPQLSFTLHACDPAMDWHIQMNGSKGEEGPYLNDTATSAAEFWGIEDMFADDEDEEEVPV